MRIIGCGPETASWHIRRTRDMFRSQFSDTGRYWGAVLVFSCLSTLIADVARAEANACVEAEDLIAKYEPPKNGAGPTWCYGSTCVARDGEDVFICTPETGKDVPPLCNTRWQLWHHHEGTWKLAQHEEHFRQREPCPIGIFPGHSLFLSVNPSTQPPGTHYGPCEPKVLEFDPKAPQNAFKTNLPVFAEGTYFTDHSYLSLIHI